MSAKQQSYRLDLIGAFRLTGPDGRRIHVASKRGQALIAMLATAINGERTRVWLQDRLWGTRQNAQAQASLRRELSNLKTQINSPDFALLGSDFNCAWLNMDHVEIDLRSHGTGGEFLEGLDVAGEDGFEDWLREQRRALEGRLKRDAAGQARLPPRIVDIAAPVPGFSNRPAVAVLPLHNLTGNQELDFFADGVAEELIERLSRLRWLPVIARSASFNYRDRAIELRDIGEALGVRYVVEGSIRLAADKLRFGLRMADTGTGLTVWTHTSDVAMPVSQASIDKLIIEMVGVMDMQIDAAEKNRVQQYAPDDLTVDELIWRGRWHLHRFTKKDGELAKQCFAKALDLAPSAPEALVQMTFCKARAIWVGRKDQDKMLELRLFAQKAIVADSEDGRAYMYAGMAELWMRQMQKAMALFKHAVELNPSLSLAHAQIGSTYVSDNEPKAALDPLRQALRLGPNDEHTFYVLGELAIAHCMLSNWDEAIDHADQSLLRRVAYWYAHVTKINALVRKGNLVEASFALKQLLEIKPDFNLGFVDWLPFHDQSWNQFLKSGLRMAGLSS